MTDSQEIAEELVPGQSPGKPTGALVKLTRHKEIMRRLLMGHRVKDIALDLNFNPGSIYVLVRTEAFQIELKRLQQIIFEHVADEMSKFKKLVPFARKFYNEVLEDNENNFSDRLKFDVSKDLLNRVGLKEPDQLDVNVGGSLVIDDIAAVISKSFKTSNLMNVEAVRKDPEGELERARKIQGENEIDGDLMAKELKTLMSGETIEIIIAEDDGMSAPLVVEPEYVKPPSKEEEETILSELVTSNGSDS